MPPVTGHYFSAGAHTLTVSVGTNGVQFYGFRVCTDFSEKPTVGTAQFTLSLRQFVDVDGNLCQPDRGFKLTCEMLRRKPDSALIWYEDFCDDSILPESYWITPSGKWDVWQEDLPYGSTARPYLSLRAKENLRGFTVALMISTSVADLPFCQTAVADQEYSVAVYSAT